MSETAAPTPQPPAETGISDLLFGSEPAPEPMPDEPVQNPVPNADDTDDTAVEERPAEQPVGNEPAPWSFERIEDLDPATASPDDLKSAAEYLQERTRKLQKHWGTSEKRRKRIEQREAEVKAAVREFSQYRDAILSNVQALRTGDGNSRLRALAQLTNQRPEDVVQELVEGIANDGAVGNQEVRTLQAEVKRLQDLFERQQEQGKKQGHQAQLQAGLHRAVQDKERWPVLAEQSAADVQGATREILQYMTANGLTIGQACDQIELYLVRRSQQQQTKPPQAKPQAQTKPPQPKPKGPKLSATKPSSEESGSIRDLFVV